MPRAREGLRRVVHSYGGGHGGGPAVPGRLRCLRSADRREGKVGAPPDPADRRTQPSARHGRARAGLARRRVYQPPLWILTMPAVVALTVRLIPARGSADRALHFPSQEVSPMIAAPTSVALAPVASPGSPPDRVMTSAPCNTGPGGTIVTAASIAPAPCVLLMIVT